MRKLALFTTLVLSASAGSALAWPWDWSHNWHPDDSEAPWDQDYDDAYDDGAYSRDHYDRYSDSRWSHEFRGRWMPIATGYSAESGRQFITLNSRPLHRLRVQAESGAPVIIQIGIEYQGDPNIQKVQLNSRLPAGAGEVISLNRNRGVKRIIVYTEPRYRGRYSVFGA